MPYKLSAALEFETPYLCVCQPRPTTVICRCRPCPTYSRFESHIRTFLDNTPRAPVDMCSTALACLPICTSFPRTSPRLPPKSEPGVKKALLISICYTGNGAYGILPSSHADGKDMNDFLTSEI